jgi:hypothetical protein
MSEREFEEYLNHCKRDLIKSFNIAKKHYMVKFQLRKDDEEAHLFM